MEKKISPNHYELDIKPVALVLHTTLSSMSSTTNHFLNPKSQVSAHFGIDRNGEVVQFVELNKGAWHAGRISNPSSRAKSILPKQVWGSLKNPNKSTIGIEFISGYDIDKDGVLERWEQLYTPEQMKAGANLVIDFIEPSLVVKFSSKNILTHRDVADFKPNLEVQRAMFIAVLEQERNKTTPPEEELPPEEPSSIITLKGLETANIKVKGGVVEIKKT